MSADYSTAAGLSKAEFQKQVDEMIRQGRAELESRTGPEIGEEARLWAALTPGWTLSLAEMCGFPDMDDGGAGPLFERMRQAGIFSVYETGWPPGETTTTEGDYFVMTPTSRAETLQPHLFGTQRTRTRSKARLKGFRRSLPMIEGLQLGDKRQTGSAYKLLEMTAMIGRRVQEVASKTELPEELDRWVLLAPSATEPDEISGIFNEQIVQAFDASDVGRIRDWIEVARPLAALLEYAGKPQLSLAIEKAGRRIELIKRRRNDFRHLASFHRREEQVEAVRRLLEGPEEAWALHFIGAGGVGKTMIIRYITCLLTAAEEAPCFGDENPFREQIAVARIDFDYLNPDYPRLHPGLLLWSFTQELRAAAVSDVDPYFNEAQRLFDQVHNELKASGFRPGERPTAHPQFIEGIRRYIDGLHVLGKRVLLILDTCEELAKADPDIGDINYVGETFRILRALHDGADTLRDDKSYTGNGVQGLRVIFSGRRLLASAGPGWHAKDTGLAPCPFLQLHEIRGFTHTEASSYLSHEKVPENLIDAVIQSSTPDVGSSIRIEFDDPADRPAELARCSPYQLRLYMDWALEDPPPTSQRLLDAAAGKYVELRIVERLKDDDLKNILPLTALLGHFDRALLRAASDLEEEDFQRVFDALVSQEWIGIHQAGVGDAPREILGVVRNVRDRMRTYFASQGVPSESTQRRAAAYLQEFTLTENLRDLDWSDFDAALSVMEHEPEQAAAWWAKVETRLLSERDLGWTLDLMARILGPDGSLGQRDPAAGADTPPENWLRPLLQATQAHAWLYTGEGGRTETNWREVAAATRERRYLPVFEALYRKAVAGRIATSHFTGSHPNPALAEIFWQLWEQDTPKDPQIAAAAVAACEALVEAAETTADVDIQAARQLLARSLSAEKDEERPVSGPAHLAEMISEASRAWDQTGLEEDIRQLLAFSFCLAGRSILIGDRPQEAMAFFRKALNHSPSSETPLADSSALHGRSLWTDWLPPENLGARVRLEIGRAAYPSLLSAEETLEVLGECPTDPTSVDVDRLQSLLLQLRLALGRPELQHLASLGWVRPETAEPVFQEEPMLPGPADCNAHRKLPPLLVRVCEALAAHGMVEHALRQLRRLTEDPNRIDLETLQHAERMLLRLISRMRLNDENESTESSLSFSPAAEDYVLTWFLQALDGSKRRNTSELPGDLSGNSLKLHWAWQTRFARTEETLVRTLAFGETHLSKAQVPEAAVDQSDFARASLLLDLVEFRLLKAEAGRERTKPGIDTRALVSGTWYEAHPAQPIEALRLMLRSQVLMNGGKDADAQVDSGLVYRIGARRAAEIGLEVAELLALRLPFHCLPVLSWAQENFEIADDPQGAFIAATLASMLQAGQTEASSGPKETPFESLLRQASRHYHILKEEGTDPWAQGLTPILPQWDQIEQLAAAPVENELDALQPVAWRPWLVRLLACLCRRRRLQTKDVALADEATLRSWLETHYGRLVDNQNRLSADWEGFFEAPAQMAPAKEKRGEWLYTLIGVAIILAALISGFYGFRWLANFSSGGDFGQARLLMQLLSYLLGLVVLGVTGSLLPRLFRVLRKPWISLGRLEVGISRGRDDGVKRPETATRVWASGESRSVVVRTQRWRPHLTFRWPPYWLESHGLTEETFIVVGAAPYQDLAKVLPRPLAKELKQLSEEVRGSGPLRVALQFSDDLHNLCWEALFSLQAVEEKDLSVATRLFRFDRRVESARTPATLLPGPLKGISLAPGEVAAAVVQRAWETGSVQGRIDWQLSRTLEHTSPEIQLLHIIGSVREDFSGLRLHLTAETSYATQIEVKQSKSFDEEAALAEPLRAEDLRRRYPDLRVLILQGDPTGETRFRFETDRQNAALTRSFAANVAREGVAVVVLPHLDSALASLAWQLMLPRLRSFLHRGPRALHPAIVKIQERIWAESEKVEAGWEKAFDICVYPLEAERAAPRKDSSR